MTNFSPTVPLSMKRTKLYFCIKKINLICDENFISGSFIAFFFLLPFTQALCSSTAKAISAKSQERAAEFFSEAMPGKSHWRNMKTSQRQLTSGSAPSLSGAVGLEAQDYARGALMFLLEPILDAVRMLPASAQVTAAAPAASALCAAWQQHILKEKLKFK